MCGIVGVIDPRLGDGLGATAEAMASRLIHRGPDAGGVWTDATLGLAFAQADQALESLLSEDLADGASLGRAAVGSREDKTMQMNDMILMSVDDHICEPADMFEKHISPKFKGREPRIVRTSAGVEAWEIEGVVRPGRVEPTHQGDVLVC